MDFLLRLLNRATTRDSRTDWRYQPTPFQNQVSPIGSWRRLTAGLLPGVLLTLLTLTSHNLLAQPDDCPASRVISNLTDPTGLFVDGSGTIYVSLRDVVRKFAPGNTTGVIVAGGNGTGDAPNQLAGSTGVFVDGAGNVYVADTDNHRVQKWAPGAAVGTTVAGSHGDGDVPNQLSEPTGVFVDGAGNVYVADRGNSRIQKWVSGATVGVTVAGGNGAGAAANQLSFPYGVFVNGAGVLYIADTGNNRIQRWAAGATTGTTVAGSTGLNRPRGVYVDGAGNVYATDDAYTDFDGGGTDRIRKYAPGATTGTTVSTNCGDRSLNVPEATSVWLDAAGNVYTNDLLFGTIWRYDVVSPIVINTQPADVTRCTGGGIGGFSLDISGSGPLFARFYRNGQPVGVSRQVFEGYIENGPSNVQLGDAGSYVIVITNGANPPSSATTTAFNLTVIPQPIMSVTNNGPLSCAQPIVTLTASSTFTGAKFIFRGPAETGGPPFLSYTQAQVSQPGTYTAVLFQAEGGCEAFATTTVINNTTSPPPPTLLTQTGQSYPGDQSAVTVGQNSGTVNLVVGGCSGTVRWSGPNSTTGTGSPIAVATNQAGSFVYQATCQVGSCSSAPASATVTVQASASTTKFSVFHQDGNDKKPPTANNRPQPRLRLHNEGTTAVAYKDITIRYWLSVEDFAPLTYLETYYAPTVGISNVTMRYVALAQPRQGAGGYIEYGFTESAGTIAPNTNSGPIHTALGKQDWSRFNETNDWSYASKQSFARNSRITVYHNGVRVGGTEPPTGGGRLAAPVSESDLQVTLLGNPATGSELAVEVRGAKDQRLHLRLTDLKGGLVSERLVERAGAIERLGLDLGTVGTGLLLLRVNTPTQSRTLKVLTTK